MKSGVFYGFLETIPILVIWRPIFRLWRCVCPYTALVARRRTFFHQFRDTLRVIEVLLRKPLRISGQLAACRRTVLLENRNRFSFGSSELLSAPELGSTALVREPLRFWLFDPAVFLILFFAAACSFSLIRVASYSSLPFHSSRSSRRFQPFFLCRITLFAPASNRCEILLPSPPTTLPLPGC
jgi:hypothetical protein